MSDVVLPARLMKLMGAKILFLTNAAGGVNYDYGAGDFMLIKDQISCFVPSPLIGPNLEELGPRFPDMSHIYDEDLRDKICGISRISNLAGGMTDAPLSHQEVQEASDKMAPLFKKLVSESIKKMGSI